MPQIDKEIVQSLTQIRGQLGTLKPTDLAELGWVDATLEPLIPRFVTASPEVAQLLALAVAGVRALKEQRIASPSLLSELIEALAISEQFLLGGTSSEGEARVGRSIQVIHQMLDGATT